MTILESVIEEEERKRNMRDDIKVIWDALHSFQFHVLSHADDEDGEKKAKAEWDEICTAMANIQEALDDPTNYNEREYDDVDMFLDALRDTRTVNMFGATPHIMKVFGLDERTARKRLQDWMEGFESRCP